MLPIKLKKGKQTNKSLQQTSEEETDAIAKMSKVDANATEPIDRAQDKPIKRSKAYAKIIESSSHPILFFKIDE